jgi:cysteine synthase A
VLTEGQGYEGFARANEIIASDPDRFLLVGQFSNPANPEIHVARRGGDLGRHRRRGGDSSSPHGMGGTITGVSEVLLRSVRFPAVAWRTGGGPCSGGPAGSHKIAGIGAGSY